MTLSKAGTERVIPIYETVSDQGGISPALRKSTSRSQSGQSSRDEGAWHYPPSAPNPLLAWPG